MRQNQPQGSTPHRTGGSTIDKILGIMASIVTVVGFVQTLRLGQLLWLGLAALAAFGFVGYLMWEKHWKIASFVLLSLAILLALGNLWQATHLPGSSTADNAATTTGHTSDTNTAGSSSGATVTTSSSPTAASAIFVETNLVIPRNAAVDVDKNPVAIITDQQGLSGNDYDLYHYWGEVASDTLEAINAPNAYTVSSGNIEQLHVNCRQAIKTNSVYDSGQTFCFKTSGGRLGYIKVTDDQSDHSFVAHLIVWNN